MAGIRKPAEPHVRIQCKAIKAACFARWTAAELKVWLALKAHQNGKNGQVWPSYSTLEDCTGLNRSGVCRGLRGLVKRKELRVLTPGGPTSSATYEVVD